MNLPVILLIVLVVVLIAVVIIQQNKFKIIALQSEKTLADLNEKEVVIEDDVWIGFNSTILKGVTIGKGAIIGANCLITKDVPPFAVVVNRVQNEIIKYSV